MFTGRADGDLVFGFTTVVGADGFMEFSEGAAVLPLTETGKGVRIFETSIGVGVSIKIGLGVGAVITTASRAFAFADGIDLDDFRILWNTSGSLRTVTPDRRSRITIANLNVM